MRRTKEDALVTREQILDSSLQIFIKKGYSQTSLEDIVNKLGLTRGAFYWHFKDKDDLLNKLIVREHTFIADLVAKAVVDGITEKDKLEQLMINLVESFYESKRYRDYVYFVRFSVEFNTASGYFKRLSGLNEFIIKEVEKILSAAKVKGEVPSHIDPVATAVYIVSMLDGMFRLRFAVKYLDSKENSKKLVTDYIKVLFKEK